MSRLYVYVYNKKGKQKFSIIFFTDGLPAIYSGAELILKSTTETYKGENVDFFLLKVTASRLNNVVQ